MCYMDGLYIKIGRISGSNARFDTGHLTGGPHEDNTVYRLSITLASTAAVINVTKSFAIFSNL